MERDRGKMNAQPQRSRSIPYLKLMGSFFLLLGHIALCAFFCPLPSAAQGQSAILMTVHDEAGKPVSQVEARLKRSGADVRVAVTNDKGECVFHGIAPGEYELTISKPGFESLAQSVVVDPHGTTAEIEFTLIPKLETTDSGQRQPTPFGRALAQLGITFIAAQSPQAKGRVERLWGVLQDRLRSELRLAKASDLDSANSVLRRFLADYNRRFARTPRDTAKAWRPAPDQLERICSFLHERIVSNDNVVHWEGRRFQIPPQNRRFSFAGAKIQLYQSLDGRVSLYYGDTRLEHTNTTGG
jgi:hypothetical protein